MNDARFDGCTPAREPCEIQVYVRKLKTYIHMESSMTGRTRATSSGGAKVSRTFRLAPGKLAAAQKILGTATATETIETALDMVVFRRELLDGTRALFGVTITSPDAE